MASLNRFYHPIKYKSRKEVIDQGIRCVFISYQKKDKAAAEKVAEYLQNAGIDIYFDRYDTELRIHHQANNPQKVTAAICNGINNR
jgi:pyrimidine deaminase RibD-like protein